ncbi:Myosin type-2 heavy chain 1 [Gurleya vavrai]
MLFNQLVSIFNKKIHTTKQNYKTITVLDIYGFENFDKNSFDQFCINWANEKIQDDFVKRMFVDLQKMYKEEGIIIDDIDYTHNGCLDVFERSCGIVDLINEESCNSFGSIDNLKTKINNYCKEIKVSKKEFLIKHYASDVSYCADDFLDKNNEVGLDYEEIFKGKNAFNNYFLNQICNNKTKDLFKKPTQLKYFKKSLDDLFESLSDSKILYVRCLKPNKKKTNSFDQDYILKQLKSSGIIETIEISKKTYSHYIYIEDFNQRYMTLTKNYNIIKGKNGVFMSNETLNMIEKEREELILLQKEIITGVLLSNFYHKKIQEDLKIVRNFVKLFVINFKKEKIQKENTKIKSDEEKLKFELENLLNEENLNFKQDKNFALNHPNLDFKNVLDCLPEKSESDIIFNDNESNDQIKKFTYKNVSNYSFLLRDKSEIDDFRFDNNEISFIGDSILVKGEQGERYMVEENLNYEKIREGDKENLILDLQNKLKKYELFYKTPCRNCKNMEIKYKFQTEELKKKKTSRIRGRKL